MATHPPSRRPTSARNWRNAPLPSKEEAGREEGDAEIQPAVDPRTVPVASGMEIHVLEGEDAGKTFPLETGEVVLGRRMTPDEKKVGWLLFNDATVSRMHAILEWRVGPRRYRLTHRSGTNPTFVNGRLVQQTLLYPDDCIRLGDLTFQIRPQHRAHGEDAPPGVEDRGHLYSGFKVSVMSGPDAGRQYVLEHKVVHVGGPEAAADASGPNWLVLTDPGLPREQAFFVWYEADKRYGVFHAGTSPVPTQISRVLITPHRNKDQQEPRNLCDVDDMVILGDTTLMFLRHERFHETVRSVQGPFAPPPPVSVAPSPSASPTPQPSPPAKEEAPPPRRHVLELKLPDPKGGEEEAQTSSPDIRVRGEGLPPHLVPPPPLPPAERQFDATSNWFSRPDYGLEVLDGPERGRRIALMSGALRAGRELLVGRPGRRVNDIELKDESIPNEQARIHHERGRFTLVNEGPTPFTVNEEPLAPRRGHALRNGDEIVMGQTVLLFIDHGALARQYQFEIEILCENSQLSQSRQVTLNQDGMTIGRSKKSQIRLNDPNVSRHHAQISFRRGGFVLEHRSETNPTFVNGVSLDAGQERILQPDDEVQLAEGTILVFRRKQALRIR